MEEMGIRTATPRRDWEGNDDAMGFSLILAWKYRSQILSELSCDRFNPSSSQYTYVVNLNLVGVMEEAVSQGVNV